MKMSALPWPGRCRFRLCLPAGRCRRRHTANRFPVPPERKSWPSPPQRGPFPGLSWPLRTGWRESAQSGREGLLAMKQRGFTRPAKLAVGDGVLGGAVGSVSIHPHAALLMHKTGDGADQAVTGMLFSRSRLGWPH